MRVIPVNPPYASAATIAHAGRPGVVTAVGVFSIILSIVQVISAFGWLGFAFTSMLTVQVQQQQQAAMNVAAYTVQPGADTAPKGLPESTARIATQGFVRRHALPEKRQAHVRTLLMRQGLELLPFAADSTLTPQRVAAQVTDSGPMGDTADFYEIGQGRMEVTDQQAIFRRTDGKVFRSTDAVVDRAFSEVQITQAIAQLSWNIDDQPSPAQVEAIRVKLRDPTQTILAPGEIPNLGGKLTDGTFWMLTSGGQIRITPAGEVQLLSTTAPIPGTNPASGRKISTFWAGLTLLDAGVTGLLAVPLLIAGIFILRGRPVGRKMHLLWAWIKLPFALLGAVVCGFSVAEWMGALTPTSGSPPPIMASAWTTGVVTGIASALYPVILLVVLTRERVRKYFEGVV